MTTSITTRSGKGSALTHAEMDANLTNLQTTADQALAATDTLTANKAEAAALGVANTDQNMGSFTGTTIADNVSAKVGMQSLETAVETKANATAVGVTSSAANMGTYTGTTIPDNETAKQNLQSLETAVETKANASALGVTSSAANMGTYTGTTISDNQTAKQNLQEVETAVEARPTSATLAASSGSSLVGFIQSGTGATATTAQAELRRTVYPQQFGAVGDGVTNDTTAIQNAIAALRSGGTLHLGDGYTYLVAESLVFEQPINIFGGSKEQSKFLFDNAGSYQTINGEKAAMIFLHSSTVLAGYSGDARRSVLSGFTVDLESSGPASMTGIFTACPIYCYEVDVTDFTAKGFAIVATNGTVAGNANGCSFTNCTAQNNTSHGFYLDGNDANNCVFTRCGAFTNGGYGFRDESLIGNHFIGCENDTNTGGAYHTSTETANRTTIIPGFDENGQTSTFGARNVILGGLNPIDLDTASGGVHLGAIPTGEGYLNQALTFASTDDIANSGGDAPNAGAFMRVGYTGFDYKHGTSHLHVKINGVASTNYTDFINNTTALIRFPTTTVTGNVKADKPFLPNGHTFGSGGSAAFVDAVNGAGSLPAASTYSSGAMIMNTNVASGQPIGWTTTGAAWVAWGNYA